MDPQSPQPNPPAPEPIAPQTEIPAASAAPEAQPMQQAAPMQPEMATAPSVPETPAMAVPEPTMPQAESVPAEAMQQATEPQAAAPLTQPTGVISGGMAMPAQPMAAPAKNKKKLIMLIAAVLGGILIIGGGAFAAMTILGSGVKLATFADDETDFTIKYPEGWKTEGFSGYATFTEDGEDKGEYQASILVVPLSEDLKQDEGYDTADNLVEQFKKELDAEIEDQEEDADNFITSYEVKKTKIAGNDAVIVDAKVKNLVSGGLNGDDSEEEKDNSGVTGTITILYVYKDDGVFGVNLIAHDSDKKYIKALDDIAASYTVVDNGNSSDDE